MRNSFHKLELLDSFFRMGVIGGDPQKIGAGFAWAEGMPAIVTLTGRRRMRAVPGQRSEIEPRIALHSRPGMPMIREQRK